MGNSQGKPISCDDAGALKSFDTVGRTAGVGPYTNLCPVNLNHFRLLRVVGKGAFGKVRIVERKDTGLTFALKYIRKEEGM